MSAFRAYLLKRIVTIAGIGAALLPGSPIAPAQAAQVAPTALTATCGVYGEVRICSAEVPSFDGTPLDADLSFPTTPATRGRRHPLMVLLHGFGNDKHEWESTTDEADQGDKWHWNSHWFATHGYYVLAYTARGFASQPAHGFEPATPPGSSRLTSPSATIHLKSQEFEVRDTQWLAALAATVLPDLDPRRVAVSGGSYGGGESWLLASQAEWTFPHSVLDELPVLSLRAAVPKYPWTDLAYSLTPNGHGGGPSGTDIYESAQGQPATGLGRPIGVVKHSYADALFARGSATGFFEVGTSTTQSTEGPINIPTWFGRLVGAGEPYTLPSGQDADPLVAQVRRGLTLFRSAYYQAANWQAQVGRREVAVFSISGWADDLFPPVESFRQFKALKRLDPRWPVLVGVADVGHPRAQNRVADWQILNDRAWRFLSAAIRGSRPASGVFSLPTVCNADTRSGPMISASAPETLAAGQLSVVFVTGAPRVLTSPTAVADANGPATDPIAHALPVPTRGAGCATSTGPATGGYTAVSEPLPAAATYVGLGYVEVPYLFSGTSGQLDARVWDVDDTGQTLLVSRGTYRLEVPAYDAADGTLRLPLFGNHWALRAGHRVRLDLTQVDEPFLRPGSLPGGLTLTSPRLVLPTRETGSPTLAGH